METETIYQEVPLKSMFIMMDGLEFTTTTSFSSYYTRYTIYDMCEDLVDKGAFNISEYRGTSYVIRMVSIYGLM